MRRCLKFLRWMGLGISALLFAATVVMWVRSVGHSEHWILNRFDPYPTDLTREASALGTHRQASLGASHGIFWFSVEINERSNDCKAGWEHDRRANSGARMRHYLEVVFQPGEWRQADRLERCWRFAGVAVRYYRGSLRVGVDPPDRVQFEIAVPLWMLAILFALWATLFVARRLLRRKRYAAGLCPHCGYDLRATPDRCPECGRVAPAAPKPESPAIGGEE